MWQRRAYKKIIIIMCMCMRSTICKKEKKGSHDIKIVCLPIIPSQPAPPPMPPSPSLPPHTHQAVTKMHTVLSSWPETHSHSPLPCPQGFWAVLVFKKGGSAKDDLCWEKKTDVACGCFWEGAGRDSYFTCIHTLIKLVQMPYVSCVRLV